jgi:predicted nuclease of predicted toxin-antitoxin system
LSEPTLVAYENLHRRIVDALRAADFEVHSVREESPGLSDREVLQLAGERRAVLITEDADFGELVFAHRS